MADSVKSESLLTDELTDNVIIALGEALPPLNAISLNIANGPLQLKESGVAGYLTEKSGTRDTVNEMTAATDAADFEPEETATNAAITTNTKMLWGTAGRSYAEALAGIPVNSLIPSMVDMLREEIWDEITALVVVANYATEVASIATADFGFDDIKTMWGLLPGMGETNGVFAKAAYKNLLPDDLTKFPVKAQSGTGAGIDGMLYPVENWTGGADGCYGMLLQKQAILAAVGIPAEPPEITGSSILDQTVITDPTTGVSFLLTQWINTTTWKQWFRLAVMAGFSVGDETALVRIQTGA